MNLKQLAVDMVRPYATRGDNYDHFKSGMMGVASKGIFCSVSGYSSGKHYDTNFIVVKDDKNNTEAIFKLREIWDLALGGQQTLL